MTLTVGVAAPLDVDLFTLFALNAFFGRPSSAFQGIYTSHPTATSYLASSFLTSDTTTYPDVSYYVADYKPWTEKETSLSSKLTLALSWAHSTKVANSDAKILIPIPTQGDSKIVYSSGHGYNYVEYLFTNFPTFVTTFDGWATYCDGHTRNFDHLVSFQKSLEDYGFFKPCHILELGVQIGSGPAQAEDKFVQAQTIRDLITAAREHDFIESLLVYSLTDTADVTGYGCFDLNRNPRPLAAVVKTEGA